MLDNHALLLRFVQGQSKHNNLRLVNSQYAHNVVATLKRCRHDVIYVNTKLCAYQKISHQQTVFGNWWVIRAFCFYEKQLQCVGKFFFTIDCWLFGWCLNNLYNILWQIGVKFKMKSKTESQDQSRYFFTIDDNISMILCVFWLAACRYVLCLCLGFLGNNQNGGY